MNVIERLISKKEELEKRLSSLYQGGSQRRETLEYRVEKIDNLIDSYRTASTSDFNLSEAKKIFDQHIIGFEEQKTKILENLETEEFRRAKNIQGNPFILCFVGPTGTGKSIFSQTLALVLKKKFFSISLEELSNLSDLFGVSENCSGIEIGQLTKSLIETKSPDPVILLDEIDKSKSFVRDSLIKVLDSEQNQEVLDYYLDVKLDFSRATFVVTANDQSKIPAYLRSRMTIIELPGYNNEQKKEISSKIIQNFFIQRPTLNSENFEITSESLEKLISKTKEKGVRQLKIAFDNVFNYCILQWSREARRGQLESKIVIDSELIDQIIPQDFSNVDQEEKKNEPSNSLNSLEDKLKELQKSIQDLQEREKFNGKNWGSLWIILLVISLMFGLPLGLFFIIKKSRDSQEQ